MFIDTHCHLHDAKIKSVAEAVENFIRERVDKVINMGCCLETSIAGKNYAEEFSSVYFAAGFHPSDSYKFDSNAADAVLELTRHNKCVAIGEIGLDRYWKENPDIEVQKRCFVAQLELAKSAGLPVSIHCREATEIMVNTLKENKNKFSGGVMHCFSGSVETAKILLDMGYYISFAGTLTFKNAATLTEVAKYVPLDRCLTETDCPYLAPHPLRGTVNEPKNVPLVAAKLAEIKDMEVSELAASVMQNAETLFYKLKNS